MAKYCSKCGKLLENNEKCTCQKKPKKERNIERKIELKKYFDEFVEIYKTIFTKPIDTIKNYTNKPNMIVSIVQMVIFILVFGFYVLSISKSIYVLYGVITKEYFTAIYNANVNSLTISTQIPYFNIFLIAILFIIILSFLTVVAIYLINSLIFKSKANIKRVFCLYSINTVLPTIALVVCLIIGFISLKLSLIILLFAIILSNIYLFSGIKFISTKDDNKYGYTYILSLILVFIVMYIIFKII